MVDPLKLLGDLKGKVLDAINFELLRTAYELQNQNLAQLKDNNGALRESNGLLKEKLDGLRSEVIKLKGENASLRQQIPPERAPYRPTGLPLQILRYYRDRDSSSLEDTEILQQLHCGKVEFEVAIKELEAAKLVRPTSYRPRNILDNRERWGGATYTLSDDARRMLFDLPKE